MNVLWILIVVSDIWSSNIFIKNNSISMQEFHSEKSCNQIKDIIVKEGGKLTYINCVEIKENQ